MPKQVQVCPWCGVVFTPEDTVVDVNEGRLTPRNRFLSTKALVRVHKECFSRRVGGQYVVELLREKAAG